MKQLCDSVGMAKLQPAITTRCAGANGDHSSFARSSIAVAAPSSPRGSPSMLLGLLIIPTAAALLPGWRSPRAVVVAPIDGVVSLTHQDMFYSGGTLIVDHGQGISSTFIHLSKILVKEGQEVKQGDPIAEVGATGRATGPHLDWRMNWFGQRLDPALLVDEMVLNAEPEAAEH